MTTEAQAAAPITVEVKTAAALSGLSVRLMYELLNKGLIESRYHGRKRLVLYASLRAYLEALPQDAPRGAA